MIDILKTVMGAVSTKDMVPVLTHFCLYDNRVQGCNGVVYIDAPFPHDVAECAVPAHRFLKAVEACDGAPVFGTTEGGKLSIKRGRFRAYIPMLPSIDFPRAALDGNEVYTPPDFLEAISRLKPFISEDASRPWSMAVHIENGYAYATNNIIVMRTPIQWDAGGVGGANWGAGEVNLPVQLVDRLLDIDANPTAIHIGPSHASFSFGDVWLRSQLVNMPWPNVAGMFSKQADEPVPAELKEAVTKIKDFCVNEKFPVIRLGDVVKTDDGETGAEFDGFDFPEAAFHADQLMKVLAIATHIDFTAYPAPCPVRGDKLEGLIVGLKK